MPLASPPVVPVPRGGRPVTPGSHGVGRIEKGREGPRFILDNMGKLSAPVDSESHLLTGSSFTLSTSGGERREGPVASPTRGRRRVVTGEASTTRPSSWGYRRTAVASTGKSSRCTSTGGRRTGDRRRPTGRRRPCALRGRGLPGGAGKWSGGRDTRRLRGVGVERDWEGGPCRRSSR